MSGKMSSDAAAGTDKQDNVESVPQDGQSIVMKEEKQVLEKDGSRDTRKRKADEKQNIEGGPEENSENKKRRLDNGKEGDDENESDTDNKSSQKSKKFKKIPSETVSTPVEPTPAPVTPAQNSLLPTVEEICAEFGLNDVKIEYRDVDYQNLTSYKFFTKHVRTILAKENPKVSAVNLMMLVAAKWREFSTQKPFIELAPLPAPPPPPAATTKKKEMPTVEEVCAAFDLKDVKIQNDEADDVDLTKYRSFAQHARNVLIKENPNVPFGKISKLVAAKWREFSSPKSEVTERTALPLPPQSAVNPEKEEKPTVQEVCATYGLKDVEIQYGQTDYENLTTYKSFTQHVRPILSKENPKVPANKLMMLAAAKWREFSSQKLALTEPTPPTSPPSPTANPKNEEMPTVQEVCAAFDLEDVKLEYDEVGDENLTDYRSFTKHVRPILSKKNPKVPTNKIMMLVAAKWREFSSQNRSQEEVESDENKENEEQNHASKSTRSRATKRKTPVDDDIHHAGEEKAEKRVTRARSGQNNKNPKDQKNVSVGSEVRT